MRIGCLSVFYDRRMCGLKVGNLKDFHLCGTVPHYGTVRDTSLLDSVQQQQKIYLHLQVSGEGRSNYDTYV